MNNQNLNFDQIIKNSGGKIQRDDLENLKTSGDASAIINNLSDQDKQKLNRILSDKSELEKVLQSPQAQMLLKPVVITDYATSASQLENGVDGMIVPMKNSLCAIAIAELLCDPDKLKSLSLNCRNADYSNAEEIRKIYEIIDR